MPEIWTHNDVKTFVIVEIYSNHVTGEHIDFKIDFSWYYHVLKTPKKALHISKACTVGGLEYEWKLWCVVQAIYKSN